MLHLETHKLNSINYLTGVIEETYMNNFSVLVYDNEGGIFNEKFASTFGRAKAILQKMIYSAKSKY